MDPATILSLIAFAIQEEPAVQTALVNLFGQGAPTPAQWESVRAQVAAMNYSTLVPNSKIPAGQ